MVKNLMLLFSLCLCCIMSIPSYSQIQIQSEGKTKSTSEVKKEVSYIQWYTDGYYFKMLDYKCSKYHLYGDKFIIKIFLGKNANEVQQSGNIIQQWFEKAKNNEYISVKNPDGQGICIYKYNANIYASYGNEDHCKAVRVLYGSDMAAALTGVAYTSAREREELMNNIEFGDYILTGLCSFKNDFMKSITNFREPGQVGEKYRQKITEQISTIKKQVREKELSDKIIVQNYNILVRELMQSNMEKDWNAIEHINTVMLEIMKAKSKINLEEIESKLSEQEEKERKLEIFEEYANSL